MDIRPTLTSHSQHWCTPSRLCEDVFDFYKGHPDLDPASNPFSPMVARQQWTLPFDEAGELAALDERVFRKTRMSVTDEEREALLLWGDRYDTLVRNTPRFVVHNALTRPWVFDLCNRIVLTGFMNPPYDNVAEFQDAVSTLPPHVEFMSLVASRTSARWFHRTIWRRATARLFFDKRLAFEQPTLDGNRLVSSAPFDSVMAYYGPRPFAFRNHFSRYGVVL